MKWSIYLYFNNFTLEKIFKEHFLQNFGKIMPSNFMFKPFCLIPNHFYNVLIYFVMHDSYEINIMYTY